jgi:hypothetical protein
MADRNNTPGEGETHENSERQDESTNVDRIQGETVEHLHDRFDEMLMTDEEYFADHDRIVNDLISFAHRDGQGRDCKVEDITYGSGKHDIGTWEVTTTGGESVTGLEYLSAAVMFYKCFNGKGGIDNIARKEALRRLKLDAGQNEDVVNKKNRQPKRYRTPPTTTPAVITPPTTTPAVITPPTTTPAVITPPTITLTPTEPTTTEPTTAEPTTAEPTTTEPTTAEPTTTTPAVTTPPPDNQKKKKKTKSWTPSSSQKPKKTDDHLRDLSWKHPSGTHGGNLMDQMAERRRTVHSAFQSIRNGESSTPDAPKEKAPEAPKKEEKAKPEAKEEPKQEKKSKLKKID